VTTAASHYNDEYTDGTYAQTYAEIPEWARGMNHYHVGLVAAILDLDPSEGPIIDLGSGRGYFVDAWERIGFTVIGVELSEVAVAGSGRSNIICGDATDLTRFETDSAQLVFSSAFLEHVTEDQVTRFAGQQLRVAKYGAHFIAHEKGNDPGHINIQPPNAWRDMFVRHSPCSLVIENSLVPTMPVIVQMRTLPAHLDHSLNTYHSGSIEVRPK